MDAVLSGAADDPFIKDFRAFHDRIAYFGMFNALSQTLVKITSPGVPDFYQGTELWDFSLVDPDNRRPVDFRPREASLQRLKEKLAQSHDDPGAVARGLLHSWKDGSVKLYVTWRALSYRNENRALFEEGDYTPLATEGKFAGNLCAFARQRKGRAVLVVVPRFVTRLVKREGKTPLGGQAWKDTRIVIPGELAGEFRNVFTGETVGAASHGEQLILKPGEILASLPVALLRRVRALGRVERCNPIDLPDIKSGGSNE